MKSLDAAKKALISAIVFTFLWMCVPTETHANAFFRKFSDIDGNFAESEIVMLSARGIIAGEGAKFFPAKSVTRAEFVKMLVTALGYEEEAGDVRYYSGVFSDIDGHWAAGYITEAWELGIVKGEGNRFYPDRSINRAEMVAMLFRAFEPRTVGYGWENRQVLKKFVDRASIPSWAAPYAAHAVEEGLVKGTPEGRFGPLRPATRAEAAKVLTAMAAKKGYIYDFYGLITAVDDKAGEIRIIIDGNPASLPLSPEAAAYKGEKKTDVKAMSGNGAYIIVDNGRVVLIKSLEE